MNIAADLMTPRPVKIPGDMYIAECARMMMRLRIRHLPVVREDGTILGMLTDSVVFQHGGFAGEHGELWTPYEARYGDLKAENLVVPVDVVVPTGFPLIDTLKKFLQTPQDIVVVVDPYGRPVGVITEHDGVRLAQGWLAPGTVGSHKVIAPLHTVRPDQPATEALKIMRDNRIRHVIVADNTRVLAVISYADLVEDDVPRKGDMKVSDVIRRDVVHIARDDMPLRDAAQTMVRRKIGCLPVVDEEGHLSGVLTRADIISVAMRSLKQEEEE